MIIRMCGTSCLDPSGAGQVSASQDDEKRTRLRMTGTSQDDDKKVSEVKNENTTNKEH